MTLTLRPIQLRELLKRAYIEGAVSVGADEVDEVDEDLLEMYLAAQMGCTVTVGG